MQSPQSKKTKATFERTMSQPRSHLSTPWRILSRCIHAPVIEPISDILARTLLRPLPVLYGAIAAVFLPLVLWFICKQFGYPMSGNEPIIVFIVGWTIGLCIDYFGLLFSGGKR